MTLKEKLSYIHPDDQENKRFYLTRLRDLRFHFRKDTKIAI